MLKKILVITQLLAIFTIVAFICGSYLEISSHQRISFYGGILSVISDSTIISILSIRALSLLVNFQNEPIKIYRTGTFEKLLFLTVTILLVPEIYGWMQWYYFSNLYLHILITYCFPLVAWMIEMICLYNKKRYAVALEK